MSLSCALVAHKQIKQYIPQQQKKIKDPYCLLWGESSDNRSVPLKKGQ